MSPRAIHLADVLCGQLAELAQARTAWRGEWWRRAAPMQAGMLIASASVHRAAEVRP